MKITVLGCGRWGTFLAAYHSKKNEVTLWGRAGSSRFQALCRERRNEYLALPDGLKLESDLGRALAEAEVVIISIGAQQLRSLAAQLQCRPVAGKTFILCMKGLEEGTGQRLTQVFRSVVTQPVHLAVWVGPGHVEDFQAGIPNCMVVDSDERQTVDFIVEELSSDLIRLYKGNDLVGTEVGSAAKNVIGIAAGMLDGRGYSCLKGALMARGAREISRLIKAMGGSELSAYGLCHLGDYEATLFSPHSHNRMFGEQFAQGRPYDKLAEGAYTVRALVRLGERYGVDLPICKMVDRILYEGYPIAQALPLLFSRTVKGEFDT